MPLPSMMQKKTNQLKSWWTSSNQDFGVVQVYLVEDWLELGYWRLKLRSLKPQILLIVGSAKHGGNWYFTKNHVKLTCPTLGVCFHQRSFLNPTKTCGDLNCHVCWLEGSDAFTNMVSEHIVKLNPKFWAIPRRPPMHPRQTCGFRPQPPAPVRYEEAANQANDDNGWGVLMRVVEFHGDWTRKNVNRI